MTSDSMINEVRKLETSMKEELAELQRGLQAQQATIEKMENVSETGSMAPASGGIAAASAMLQSSKMSRVTQQVDKLREDLEFRLSRLRQDFEDEKTKHSSSLDRLASKSEDLQRRLNDAESGNKIQQTHLEKFKKDVLTQLVNVQTSTATAQLTTEKVSVHAEQLSVQQAAIQKLQRELYDDKSQRNSTVKEMPLEFAEQDAAIARLQQELFDQRSQQNATVQACRETVLATARECEQLALKTSSAETTIAELRHGFHDRMAAIDAFQKELSSELDAQGTQLREQSCKFTGVVADTDELKLKLSVLESSFDETCALIGQKAESAIAQQASTISQKDLSMQSELHSHFLGLKETVDQLRSELAVQSNMHRDFAAQQKDLSMQSELHSHFLGLKETVDRLQSELTVQSNMYRDLAMQPKDLSMQSELHSHFLGVKDTVDRLRSELTAVQLSMHRDSAAQQKDLSMQSELHDHFLGLKGTVDQLRSELAVQSSMHRDFEVQQARLQNLDHDVSEMKLITRVAVDHEALDERIQSVQSELREDLTKTLADLEEGVQTLRIEMQKNFTSLQSSKFAADSNQERTGAVFDARAADRLDKLEEDLKSVSSRANKMEDVVKLVQAISTGAQRSSQDALKTKNCVMQMESRVGRLEKSILDPASARFDSGSVSEASDPAKIGTEREATKEVTHGLKTDGWPLQSPVPPGSLESMPKETLETTPGISEDLAIALNSLVAQIHHTVSVDASALAGAAPDSDGGPLRMPAGSREGSVKMRGPNVGRSSLSPSSRNLIPVRSGSKTPLSTDGVLPSSTAQARLSQARVSGAGDGTLSPPGAGQRSASRGQMSSSKPALSTEEMLESRWTRAMSKARDFEGPGSRPVSPMPQSHMRGQSGRAPVKSSLSPRQDLSETYPSANRGTSTISNHPFTRAASPTLESTSQAPVSSERGAPLQSTRIVQAGTARVDALQGQGQVSSPPSSNYKTTPLRVFQRSK